MEIERDDDGLTRHQQHVVAHVIGCELFGIAHLKDEVILALDVPFVWSIAADGSMDLGAATEIADRLGLSESETKVLDRESQALRDGDDSDNQLFSPLPNLLRVFEVTASQSSDGTSMVVIGCEYGSVIIKGIEGIASANIEYK